MGIKEGMWSSAVTSRAFLMAAFRGVFQHVGDPGHGVVDRTR